MVHMFTNLFILTVSEAVLDLLIAGTQMEE